MKQTMKTMLAAVVAMMTVAYVGCGKEENNSSNATVEWVDLGLPSGLLWASCNVGASAPVEYGDYFAWGEIGTKNVYEWSTYAYGDAGDKLSKYCNKPEYGLNGFTDNLTSLTPSDDVAAIWLGNGARIPSREEWQELLDNTTVEWTSVDGVNGCLCTAVNGNSLFLPAAGFREGSKLWYAGRDGLYWSASLNTDRPFQTWDFEFDEYAQGMEDAHRLEGQSVRAVHSAF